MAHNGDRKEERGSEQTDDTDVLQGFLAEALSHWTKAEILQRKTDSWLSSSDIAPQIRRENGRTMKKGPLWQDF